VIAAFSEEHGLIDYVVHPKAINLEVFVAFINKNADKHGRGDFTLLLENLRVHRTKFAKHLFEKLNIKEIFNVPQCVLLSAVQWNRKLLLPTQGHIQETPSEMCD
jgi:hypothetical protein